MKIVWLQVVLFKKRQIQSVCICMKVKCTILNKFIVGNRKEVGFKHDKIQATYFKTSPVKSKFDNLDVFACITTNKFVRSPFLSFPIVIRWEALRCLAVKHQSCTEYIHRKCHNDYMLTQYQHNEFGFLFKHASMDLSLMLMRILKTFLNKHE